MDTLSAIVVSRRPVMTSYGSLGAVPDGRGRHA